jgi:hypothetical protein
MERTAAEARAEYERIMGVELGALYSLLWQELAWIHSRWAEYVVLFGTSPERVALLNETAPSFCRLIQDSLWDGVLLHIARLTDPATSFGKPNLSLLALINLIDRPATKAKVKTLVQASLVSAAFARDWRNRNIAHKDLQLALANPSQPLAQASRALVAKALEDLAAVLNCIALDYLNSTSFFEGGPEAGGALELLYVLDDGLAIRRGKRARLEAGEYNAADFQHRNL